MRGGLVRSAFRSATTAPCPLSGRGATGAGTGGLGFSSGMSPFYRDEARLVGSCRGRPAHCGHIAPKRRTSSRPVRVASHAGYAAAVSVQLRTGDAHAQSREQGRGAATTLSRRGRDPRAHAADDSKGRRCRRSLAGPTAAFVDRQPDRRRRHRGRHVAGAGCRVGAATWAESGGGQGGGAGARRSRGRWPDARRSGCGAGPEGPDLHGAWSKAARSGCPSR